MSIDVFASRFRGGHEWQGRLDRERDDVTTHVRHSLRAVVNGKGVIDEMTEVPNLAWGVDRLVTVDLSVLVTDTNDPRAVGDTNFRCGCNERSIGDLVIDDAGNVDLVACDFEYEHVVAT